MKNFVLAGATDNGSEYSLKNVFFFMLCKKFILGRFNFFFVNHFVTKKKLKNFEKSREMMELTFVNFW